MSVTLLTSHEPTSVLNDVASLNMSSMFVTPLVHVVDRGA